MPRQALCRCEAQGQRLGTRRDRKVCRQRVLGGSAEPRSPRIRLGSPGRGGTRGAGDRRVARGGAGWLWQVALPREGEEAGGTPSPAGIPPRRQRCSVPAQPGSSAGREGTRACGGHGREQPHGDLAPKPAGGAEHLEPDAARGHPLPGRAAGRHGEYHAQRPCQPRRPQRQRLHVHPVRHDALRRHRGQPHPGLHSLPQGGQAQRPLPRLHQEQGLHDLSPARRCVPGELLGLGSPCCAHPTRCGM